MLPCFVKGQEYMVIYPYTLLSRLVSLCNVIVNVLPLNLADDC